MTTNETTTAPSTTCDFCGQPTEDVHSGVLECPKCWSWRKLDGPAARHWNRVAAEFLSNVDMYDILHFFKKAGLTQEEATVMLNHARTLLENTRKMIDEHSPIQPD